MAEVQLGFLLRTSPDCSPPVADEISLSFSRPWQNSGRWTLRGECWTASSSEFRNGAVVCSLSQILEESVPPKYWLSPKACRGILRRAERRGRELPEPLRLALQAAATTPEPTEQPAGTSSRTA